MSDLAVSLTDPVDTRVLLTVLAQVRRGDFTARMPMDWTGVSGEVANVLNEVIIANQTLAAELAQDITDRKRLEDDLAHQALHDGLTGLPNRALLTDRLVQGLAGSRRRGSRLGVIFLDIDHFKAINESLGHCCGDDVLKQTAGQIGAALRFGDTVARWGADEFVIVCDDVSALQAHEIATRVIRSGGRIIAVRKVDIPGGKSLAAILRYAM